MDHRKLIKFGTSSYVISIPTSWIKKNNLEKGDTVYLDEKANGELTIVSNDNINDKEDSVKNIAVENRENNELQRLISTAYINNYRIINIVGVDLYKKSKFIKEILGNLVAVEIIEQSSQKIVAKDFLDNKTISIENTVKKIDMIIRSIFKDSTLTFQINNFEDIYQRDEDVNKLTFLLFKIIKSTLNNPQLHKKLNVNNEQLMSYWQLGDNLEKIADEIKRIARIIAKKELKEIEKTDFLELYSKVEAYYLKSMKLYYAKDGDNAIKLTNHKSNYAGLLNEYLEEHNRKEVLILIERLRIMTGYIHNISRIIYEIHN